MYCNKRFTLMFKLNDRNTNNLSIIKTENITIKLQEEVRTVKCALSKMKMHHKRLLDTEDNVKMYVYGFRDISTKCRTGFYSISEADLIGHIQFILFISLSRIF